MEENQNNNIEKLENSATQCANKKCHHVCSHISMAVMFVAIVVLYILHFTGNHDSLVNEDATKPINTEGGVSVAYINTDTLMAKYQYALDLQKELEQYQSSKEASYKEQMSRFESDYNNYLKNGADMTLSQQKSTEAELKKRMEKLQTLEGEYAAQIQKKTFEESEKMTKAVYNYIRDYNEKNSKFDIILSKSFNNSPVLYGNPGMDITDEIVKGLNEDYEKSKE